MDLIEAIELAARFGLESASTTFGLSRKARHRLSPEEAFEIALRRWALGIDRQPGPGLVQRIGSRRAAAMALELGELLALRVPHRAPRMLQFARQQFRKCGDFMRAAIASACLALTYARAGSAVELEREVSTLKALFERRRNDLVNPENWRAIQATVTKPEANPGMEVQPAWMRPWLLRAAMSVALSRDGGSPGQFSDNVRQVWLRVARRIPPGRDGGGAHSGCGGGADGASDGDGGGRPSAR